ncbi:hypothetical protein AURDEDRAFT_160428 [Auricularia subglabra TFB-10046 SS5]|nr:hypothetical protein AURDEDRAFT_160428 [Auricularia subglabra TFB-10046 SS5]
MFTTCNFKLTSALSLVLAALVNAEQHVVIFNNRCGFGTAILAQPSTNQVLFRSPGPEHNYDAFVTNSSLNDFLSCLWHAPALGRMICVLKDMTGSCGLTGGINGTGCTVVRGKLALPAQGGSSATIDSAPPFADSFPTTLLFTDGSDPGCYTGGSAQPNSTVGPFNCPTTNDINIAIQFC